MVTSVLDQVDKPPHVDHGSGHDEQVRIVPGKVCKFQIGKNEEPEQCGECPEHHTSGGNNSTHHVITSRFTSSGAWEKHLVAPVRRLEMVEIGGVRRLVSGLH